MACCIHDCLHAGCAAPLGKAVRHPCVCPVARRVASLVMVTVMDCVQHTGQFVELRDLQNCRKRWTGIYRACMAPHGRSRCCLQRARASCAWKQPQRKGRELRAGQLPCPVPCPGLGSLQVGWQPGWRLRMALQHPEWRSSSLPGEHLHTGVRCGNKQVQAMVMQF